MHIRCWGSRGSIPVSGRRYIRYGGDTTCLEIRSKSGDVIVVDAGSGIRSLGIKLSKERPASLHMLFTHAHIDHIMGFPFFAPVYRKESRIFIHGRPFAFPSYERILRGIMTSPYCPVEFDDLPAHLEFIKLGAKPFPIGSISITPVPISHPNGGTGFRFEEGGKSFVFLTDNELEYVHPGGLTPEKYAEFCSGADLLIHDAEYTEKDCNPKWGHSIFTDVVQLAMAARVCRLGLFHINQKRTDAQVDGMVDISRKMVRRGNSKVACFAVSSRFEATL